MTADRTSPLAALGVHSGAGWRLAEVPFTGQLNLRVRPQDTTTLGVTLPLTPNTMATGDGLTVLWLGPDEWLILTPDGAAGEVAARCRAALAGVPHSVLDVSAQRTLLALDGPAAAALLAHGCALDLERQLGPGRCAQTMLARAQVVLWRVENGFRLLVRASFAHYLAAWVLDAATEYLVSSAPDSEEVHGQMDTWRWTAWPGASMMVPDRPVRYE